MEVARARAPPPRGFNQSANSFQTNPNKTKQFSLDFLGFIRPIRGFSMGYEQKNKKNRIASQVARQVAAVGTQPSWWLTEAV
jgi:hypothetical protein